MAASSFVHSGEIHRPDGSVAAFVFALLLHVLLVVLLVLGVRWQTPAKPAAIEVMQATVVQDDSAKRQIEQLKHENEKLQALEAEKAKQAQLDKQALEAKEANQKELEKQKSQEPYIVY